MSAPWPESDVLWMREFEHRMRVLRTDYDRLWRRFNAVGSDQGYEVPGVTTKPLLDSSGLFTSSSRPPRRSFGCGPFTLVLNATETNVDTTTTYYICPGGTLSIFFSLTPSSQTWSSSIDAEIDVHGSSFGVPHWIFRLTPVSASTMGCYLDAFVDTTPNGDGEGSGTIPGITGGTWELVDDQLRFEYPGLSTSSGCGSPFTGLVVYDLVPSS